MSAESAVYELIIKQVVAEELEKFNTHMEQVAEANRVLRSHLAYALGIIKGLGGTYPAWLDDAAFDV